MNLFKWKKLFILRIHHTFLKCTKNEALTMKMNNERLIDQSKPNK